MRTKLIGKLTILGHEAVGSRAKLDTPITKEADAHAIEIIVAGSLAIDLSCDYHPSKFGNASLTTRSSNPAIINQSLGGVGQNIATAASYAGAKVRLYSVVGNDLPGKLAKSELKHRGLSDEGIRIISGGVKTAQYVAVNDEQKNLVIAMADMHILEENWMTILSEWSSDLDLYRPHWLVIDANWNPQAIRGWAEIGLRIGAKIAFEPVSVEKSTRIFFKTKQDRLSGLVNGQSPAASLSPSWPAGRLVDLAAPNEMELLTMSEQARATDVWTSFLAHLDEHDLQDRIMRCLETPTCGTDAHVPLAALKLLSSMPCILTKLGPKGVLLTEVLKPGDSRLQDRAELKHVLFRKASSSFASDQAVLIPEAGLNSGLSNIGGIYMRRFPPEKSISSDALVSVNGAGDTFLGVLIAAMVKWPGRHVSELVDVAQRAATLTLKSKESVSPEVRGILEHQT